MNSANVDRSIPEASSPLGAWNQIMILLDNMQMEQKEEKTR